MNGCVAGLYCVGGILSLFLHKSYPIMLGMVLEAAGCVVLSTASNSVDRVVSGQLCIALGAGLMYDPPTMAKFCTQEANTQQKTSPKWKNFRKFTTCTYTPKQTGTLNVRNSQV